MNPDDQFAFEGLDPANRFAMEGLNMAYALLNLYMMANPYQKNYFWTL